MPWKTDLSIYEIIWNLRQLYEQLLDIMQYVCETFRANCFLYSDLLLHHNLPSSSIICSSTPLNLTIMNLCCFSLPIVKGFFN